MSTLQEITFLRLLPKYERVFGEPPPFTATTVDDAVAFMRDRLLGQCDPDQLASRRVGPATEPSFGRIDASGRSQ
jgi:hypothetical protein